MESRQSPCPYKVVDDLGTAYGMGCLGGAVWHFGSGFRHNPKGARLRGALERASIRAPQTGGSFAAWGGLFSVVDCSLIAIRQKEDPINAISAGALTGGILAIRAGWGAAAKNALVGGCLLALIEGIGFFVGRATAQDQSNIPPPVELLGSRSSLSTISKSATAASLQNDKRAGLLLKDEQAQTLMTDFGTDDFTFDDTDDLD